MENNNIELYSYLFFSVDIVDSISFKRNYINEWCDLFKSFYKDFPNNYLFEECKKIKKNRNEEISIEISKPHIWKTIGDEITFYVDICKSFEEGKKELSDKTYYDMILYYITALFYSIKNYNKDAENKINNYEPALKIKGTAWFANVVDGSYYDGKYGNIRIPLSEVDEKNCNEYDFIGRQIDIGFRIAKYSTLNQLIISVELAILLLRDNYLTIEDLSMKICYSGRNQIKGIFENIGYPIIYIDMMDKLNHSENKLLNKNDPGINMIDLMRFLEEFIKNTNHLIYYPFINEKDRLFKRKPFDKK